MTGIKKYPLPVRVHQQGVHGFHHEDNMIVAQPIQKHKGGG